MWCSHHPDFVCHFYKKSFSVINNLGTPSFEMQINFGVLQIESENSATGLLTSHLGRFLVINRDESILSFMMKDVNSGKYE